MTPEQIKNAEQSIEDLFMHYYRMAEVLGEDARIGSFVFQVQAKGSTYAGFEVKYRVCLDGNYLSGSDPEASTMSQTFSEALRRRGYDVTHRETKLIGRPLEDES